MDAPDELRQAVADAILHAQPTESRFYAADAVLAVPAIADALARDRKVREIVAATREWAGSTDPAPPISYIYADGFDDIAAQYPKEHQPMSKPTRITAEWVAAEKAAAIKSGMTEQAAEELVTKLYASKHVTDGERCWCDPQVETVPAKKSATEAADTDIRGCNCASYNNPEKVRPTVSGPVSEVVLTPPPELGIERETVCVDACIATVVQHLWSCGVVTLGSCCGHGRERPGLVLGQHEDMAVARACISGVDDRAWDLSQWRLVKNTDMNPANEERNDQ